MWVLSEEKVGSAWPVTSSICMGSVHIQPDFQPRFWATVQATSYYSTLTVYSKVVFTTTFNTIHVQYLATSYVLNQLEISWHLHMLLCKMWQSDKRATLEMNSSWSCVWYQQTASWQDTPEHPTFDSESYMETLVPMFALFSEQILDLRWGPEKWMHQKHVANYVRWSDRGPCKRKSDFTSH